MWLDDFEKAKEESLKLRKPVLLQFELDNCGGCKKLYDTTYQDEKVKSELENWFVPLKLDLLKNRDVRKIVSSYWTPSFYFMDHNGKSFYSFKGYLPPEEFRLLMRIGAAEAMIPKGKYDDALNILEDDSDNLSSGSLFNELQILKGEVIFLIQRDNSELKKIMKNIKEKDPESIQAKMYFWEE